MFNSLFRKCASGETPIGLTRAIWESSENQFTLWRTGPVRPILRYRCNVLSPTDPPHDASPVSAFYESFYDSLDIEDANDASRALCPRLAVFAEEYLSHRVTLGGPIRILDVGCGRDPLLASRIVAGDEYWGVDIVKPSIKLEHFVQMDLNMPDFRSALDDLCFDVIFCSEVIEHVFSPDALLREMKLLMHESSLLLLSTPNLAYWANRILLPIGISPLFLENSAERKLGRRLRRLGQNNHTEGHLHVFTHRAMMELLALQQYRVERVRSVPLWEFRADRFACRISPHIAPSNVYIAKSH